MKRVGSCYHKNHGFTIVELLVVIVVIGILAAISIVSYNGITKRANDAAIQSDLDNNKKLLQMYQVENGVFPTELDGDNCPELPVQDLKKCLKVSSGATMAYGGSGSDFVLGESKDSSNFQITNTQAATAVSDNLSYGLVSEWKFNGNANDSVGNYNGTVSGVTSDTGKNGLANGSYRFTGVNGQYIDFGDSSRLINYTDISFSAWVNFGTSNSGNRTILAKEGQYKYRLESNNSVSIYLNANGTWTRLLFQPKSFSQNTWYHIVATISSSSGLASVFVDGNQIGQSESFSAPVMYNPSNYSRLVAGTYDNEMLDGWIDDARLYNWALSPSFVKKLYEGTKDTPL